MVEQEEDATALPVMAVAAATVDDAKEESEKENNEEDARLLLQQQSQSRHDTSNNNAPIVDHTPAAVVAEASAESSRLQDNDEDSSLAPQVATEDRTLLYDTGGGGGGQQVNDNDDDDSDVYDDENEEAYMPIVDHTPKSSSRGKARKSSSNDGSNNNDSNSAWNNRRDSMVVQVGGTTSAANDDDDFDDDDDDDTASISNAAAICKSTTLSRPSNAAAPKIDSAAVIGMEEPSIVVLVDHTPQDTESRAAAPKQKGDLSVAVLPSVGNTTIDERMDTGSIYKDDDDYGGTMTMMDQTLDFGPVVDHTPPLDDSDQKPEQQKTATAAPQNNLSSSSSAAAADADASTNFIHGDDSMAVFAPADLSQQDEAMYDDDDSSTTSSEGGGGGDGNSTIDTQEEPNRHKGKGDDASSELLQSSVDPQPLLSIAKPLLHHDVKREQHVVDHTPMDISTKTKQAVTAADLSVVVLATVDDLTRDTGVSDIDEDNEDIYKDENELDYAPIVDHTPPSVVAHAGAATTLAATNQAAATSSASASSSCRFSVNNNSMAVHGASALDQDFEQHDAMEETMYNITVDGGGTSTVDGSVINDWERNETSNLAAATAEEVVTNLVDHTPLDMMTSPTPLKNTDPSIAVLASIEDDDENVGETEEEDVVFGLVVDHLPTTPASTSVRGGGAPCSDSVIVQIAEETVDEITRDDYGSTTTDGDTVDDDDGGGGGGAASSSSVFRSSEGKLVDHVPSVRGSRLTTGDASTLVAADASENLDDMAPDESYFDLFGPVVDVIPSPILSVSRSQQRAPARASEVAVVATTSASADTNVLVDHVPPMRETRLTDDSIATMGLSKLSEEDDDEGDDRQFGPIVDHLPTPRTSRAASRGGCSTGDDLATISEAACPGDNEWEDDDLDMSLQSERIHSSQRPQTPVAGVFRDTDVVRRVMSSNSSDKGLASSVVRFDTSGFPDAANIGGGGWYDENGPTESEVPTASFEDAETPPTTPHQRISLVGIRRIHPVPINEELLQPFDIDRDQYYADVTTTRYAKLVNVTKRNDSMFGTVITPEGMSLEVDFGVLLLQGDDNGLTFSKEEVSTTLELEEDLLQLRQTNACFREKIESLQTEAAKLRQDNSRLTSDLMNARRKEEVKELLRDESSSKPASTAKQPAVLVLEANDDAQQANKMAQEDALRQDNSRLTANLARAQRRIEELEQSETTWGKRQSALEAEIAKLKQQLAGHTECR
jgi:hypothetical protein